MQNHNKARNDQEEIPIGIIDASIVVSFVSLLMLSTRGRGNLMGPNI